MRIDHIDIRNLRRFECFDGRFQPGFNVIIGENGAGKTTLLTFLRRVLSAWSPTPERLVAPADVRETLRVVEGAPTRLVHRPWVLGVEGVAFHGIPFSALDGDMDGSGMSLSETAGPRTQRFHMEAEGNLDLPLPLLAYFSPWREPPRLRKPRINPAGAPRRLDGYVDAFDLHADFMDFASWFKGFEMQRIEDAKRVSAVEAVRSTVISCIPGCTDLRWIPVLNDIIVTIDGTTHLIWRLSDGFRTMLSLVGELAWRAAVLNPAFGADVAKKITGVVLIDELDLHLHPRWQRRVVNDLRVAFPGVQFIATTHSPFVVQSMRPEEVTNLDHLASLDFQRSSIEDIAETSMGVEDVQRSEKFEAMVTAAERYFAVLADQPASTKETERLKAELDRLTEPFADNPAYVALLRSERAARGLG